jgi:hypothetical protein
LGIQEEAIYAVRIPTGEGEAAIQHVETMFPLWFQQKGLLKLLQATRRERHLQMKNENRKERKKRVGGTTRETNVESKRAPSSIGESGKEQLLGVKATGVAGHHEKERKEVQRGSIQNDKDTLDGGDTQKNGQHGQENHEDEGRHSALHNPLEQNLGFFDFGSYRQADPNAPYAFERVNQI